MSNLPYFSNVDIIHYLSTTTNEMAFNMLSTWELCESSKIHPAVVHGGLAFEYIIDKNYLLANTDVERSHDCDIIVYNSDDNTVCDVLDEMCDLLHAASPNLLFCHLLNYNKCLRLKGAEYKNYFLTNAEILSYQSVCEFSTESRPILQNTAFVHRACLTIKNSAENGMVFDIVETFPHAGACPADEVALKATIPIANLNHVSKDVCELAKDATYPKRPKAIKRLEILGEFIKTLKFRSMQDLIFPYVPNVPTFDFVGLTCPYNDDNGRNRVTIATYISSWTKFIKSKEEYKNTITNFTGEYSSVLSMELIYKWLFKKELSAFSKKMDNNLIELFKYNPNNTRLLPRYNLEKLYTYRITNVAIDKHKNFINDLAVNSTFTSPTYLSSSWYIFPNQLSFSGFTENCIMIFKWTMDDINKGRIIFIEGISINPTEGEVIINKDIVFIITARYYANVISESTHQQKLCLELEVKPNPTQGGAIRSIKTVALPELSPSIPLLTQYDIDQVTFNEEDSSIKYSLLLFTDFRLPKTVVEFKSRLSIADIKSHTNEIMEKSRLNIPIYEFNKQSYTVSISNIRLQLIKNITLLDKESLKLLTLPDDELIKMMSNTNKKINHVKSDILDEDAGHIYRAITSKIIDRMTNPNSTMSINGIQEKYITRT